MATLRLQTANWNSENTLVESLIHEATQIHGDNFIYIPRQYVAKSKILGEDRLSIFTDNYPLIMYLKSNEEFAGSGPVMSKFGLQIDQQATLTITRKDWKAVVGSDKKSILPDRPAEGDLIYWPRNNAILEVMFVEGLSPFYQLGQLYIFELTVERFRYGGEKIQTGIAALDTQIPNLQAKVGQDVTKPMTYGDNTELREKAQDFVFDQNNPFGDL